MSGISDWFGRGSQAAPESLIVLGVCSTDPVRDRQVALTKTSSTLHIAGRDKPFSGDARTTRKCWGGDTPFSPFLPAGPCGPCRPGGPAGPAGPGSPLAPASPLSPLGPEHPATARAKVPATMKSRRISSPDRAKRSPPNVRGTWIVPGGTCMARRPGSARRGRSGGSGQSPCLFSGSIGAWRPIGGFSQLYGYRLDRCGLRADVQRNHFWGGCGNRALFAHRFVAECQVLQPLFGEDIGVSGQGAAARNQFPDIFVSHGSNAIIQKKFVIDPATGPAPDTGFVSIAEISERSHPYLKDLARKRACLTA